MGCMLCSVCVCVCYARMRVMYVCCVVGVCYVCALFMRVVCVCTLCVYIGNVYM